MQWQDVRVIEQDLSRTACECCGNTTLTIDGDLELNNEWLAFYWVRWTEQHTTQGPVFFVGVGNWSDDAPKSERWAIKSEFSKERGGFILLDPDESAETGNWTSLGRDDILGTSFAEEYFAMIDAIYMKDSRLEEIRA